MENLPGNIFGIKKGNTPNNEFQSVESREAQINRWEKIVLTQGYSGLLAVFAKREYSIGGKVIKSDTDSKWKTYIVHNSHNPPVPTENSFSNLVQETTKGSKKHFSNDKDKPENLDVLTINSLNNVDFSRFAYEENNVEEVSGRMFGVSFETTRENFGHRTLTHMMLLPKDQLKEFTDECLKDPTFVKDLTDKLLVGIDDVFPRQEAKTIMVITDKKVKSFDV